MTTPDTDAFLPFFVARQPVVDADWNIWGYELLFRRHGQAKTAEFSDPSAATARVIADGIALVSDGIRGKQKLLINFPGSLLLSDSALALPHNICIPEILESVRPDPPVLQACRRLKKEGYTLALDDYSGDSAADALLGFMDIVKVDVLAIPRAQVMKVAQKLRPLNIKLIAEKVETAEVYHFCEMLGFDMFQGYYFSKPQIIPGRTLSTGQITRLQLMRQLSQDQYDVGAVATTISQDPSLSFRLLRLLNSSAFQLSKKIDSIQQAVAYVGGRALRQWLLVVALSDLGESPLSKEFFYTSLLNGRFLSRCTGCLGPSGLSEDGFFLLGILSHLDALLGQPMEEILVLLGLSEIIEQALLGQDSPAAKPLQLAYALEFGAFDAAAALLHDLGVPFERAARIHVEASQWAQTLAAV